MSLEEVIQFVEAKEAGKRSAGRLQEAQATNATRSQYHKAKQDEHKFQHSATKETCHYCGQTGHAKRASKSIRMKACPAYGKTCRNCGRPNHTESVCQQKTRSKPPRNDHDNEGAIFNSLCSTSSAISIDHHLYSQLNDCWIRQSSKPQPFITLTTSLFPEDYKTFGTTPPNIRRRTIAIPAMADTGCQSCLASMKIIERFGLQEKDLIPVTMRMFAANNKGIIILGATILRFSGKSKSGETLETRQITYVTSDSERLFLSREACIALGMISEKFPTVGEASPLTTSPTFANETLGNTDATPMKTPQSSLTPVQQRQPRHNITEDLRYLPTSQSKTPEPTTPPVEILNPSPPPIPTSTPAPNPATPEDTQPPGNQVPESTTHPVIPKKPPLALRRLLDHNNKGLKEK